MRRYQKILLAVLLVIPLVDGCKKANTCSVPNVYVDFYVYSSDPAFIKLNAIGGWVYVTGGSKGIIVYHQSVDLFMAYDRNCTYNPSNGNVVQVDSSNNITVFDPICGSKYSLYDGSVLQGPASCPLKQYNTSVNGTAIHVYS